MNTTRSVRLDYTQLVEDLKELHITLRSSDQSIYVQARRKIEDLQGILSTISDCGLFDSVVNTEYQPGWAMCPKEAMQYVPSGWYEINSQIVYFDNSINLDKDNKGDTTNKDKT